MIWLWIYLGAGLAVCTFFVVAQMLRQKIPASEILTIMRGPVSFKAKLLEKMGVPLLASLALVVGWPLAMWYIVKEKRNERRQEKRRMDAIFKVRSKDLGSITTVSEAEASARIVDPLSAVSNLPFGHLNGVWKDFLAGRQPNAELWTFACVSKSQWGSNSYCEGFVWVLGDDCKPWIFHRIAGINEEKTKE